MMSDPLLTTSEIVRYRRQTILEGVGEEGQIKLKSSKVLIVGLGGLGSPVALYLAAAGVGTLGIVDSDTVALENLQRQVVHAGSRIGRKKTLSAHEVLTDLNPDIAVNDYDIRLSEDTCRRLVKEYDVVVDSCDNFPTRYLLNRECVQSGRPLIHAGVLAFRGQTTVIIPGEGPCFQCIFPDPPEEDVLPTTSTQGILGSVAGTLGTIQASETIKILLRIGNSLLGRMLVYDALDGSFRTITLQRDPQCPVCGA